MKSLRFYRFLQTSGLTMSALSALLLSVSPVLAQNPSPTVIVPGGNKPQAPAAGKDGSEEEYAKDSDTEINVKNADIAAIIRIFSRKTKRNYILDEKVKGKVSIYLPGKVSSDESLRILDAVLALKGFTSVPIGENIWKIIPSKDARQSTIPTMTESSSDQPSAAVVTRLVNLKYVSAEDVQQVLSQLISPDGLINAYTATNSLILIDSEDNIERLVKLVNELDVPSSDRDMTIVPVKHADASEVADKITEILSDKSNKGDTGSDLLRARMNEQPQFQQNIIPNPNNPTGIAPPRSVNGKTVSARAREPKIIADDRTNSIIVVADEETTARVRALISQLDSKVDLSGAKFYVYRCQHANAQELAEVMQGIAGGGSGSSSSSSSSGGVFGESSSGSKSKSTSSSSNNNRRNSTSGSSGSSMFDSGGDSGGGSSTKKGTVTASLGDNISITADPATNSLIIAANKADYEKIKALLEKLDVKRRQVLVEATLLEVSIDKNFRVSTDFLTSTGGADGGVLVRSDFAPVQGSLASLFQDPTRLQGFTMAAASAGTLKLPGNISIPTQSVLVSAAEANNNVNVLSAPTILATDNETAQIVVGQNVPFLASTSTNETNLNNTFNQVDREDVGITLKLTPQISSRDYVTLKLYTEVSSLLASTLDSRLGPTTNKRESETTVIAKDGQMIVTGGLITDEITESENGVPFLKDIPVLGSAFKSDSQAHGQKNLLIFLTPRIIKDQYDERDVTIENTQRLRDVIKSYGVEPGRDDVLRHERIDNVAETNTYDGPKPTTIRPPKRFGALNQADDTIHSDAIIADGSKVNSDGAIELEVGPEQPRLPDERASMKIERIPSQANRDTFVVLQFEKSADSKRQYPFSVSQKGDVVGMIIPKESPSSAKSFFEAGSQCLYQYDEQRIPLRVLGTFTDIQDARTSFSGLPANWYTISPYEIMNIGETPWTKK